MSIKEWYQVSAPFIEVDTNSMQMFTQDLNTILLDISQRLGSIDTSAETNFDTAALVNLHLAGTLEVDGVTTLTGATTLASTLAVAGATTLSGGLAVTGNITVSGTVDGIDIASHTHSHSIIGSTHEDAASGTVARGSIIYGNATPKWDELAIGVAGTVLTSNGTDISWVAGGASPWTDNETDISVTNGEDIHLHTTNQQLLISESVTDTSKGGALRILTSESLSMGVGTFFHANVIINTRSGGTGEREAFTVHQNFSGAATNSNNVALYGLAHCTANSGTAFGANAVAWTDPGVSEEASCIGAEINTRQERTGNVVEKIGLNIIDIAGVTSNGDASSISAGLRVGKSGASIGYDYGAYFGTGGGTVATLYSALSTFKYDVASGGHYWYVGGGSPTMSLVGGVLNTSTSIASPTITATSSLVSNGAISGTTVTASSIFEGPGANNAARIRIGGGNYTWFAWANPNFSIYVDTTLIATWNNSTNVWS